MNAGSFLVSSPGKIVLFGEHAVVHGKSAVAVAMNLRTKVSVSICDFDYVELNLGDLGGTVQWSFTRLDELCSFTKSDPHMPTNCFPQCKEYIQDFLTFEPLTTDVHESCSLFLFLYINIVGKNRNFKGLRLHVSSDVPIGAGLGSSAAFSVCLSTALLGIAQALTSTTANYVGIPFHLTEDDKRLINQWALMAERITHSNASGVDNTVCTYGGALRYQCGQFQQLNGCCMLKILAVNSNVTRTTKSMINIVSDRMEKYPGIMTPILDAIDQIVEKFVSNFEIEPSEDNNNALFYIMEDLITINQNLLCAMGVSHDKLDEIVAVAKSHGMKAKLTGAGGGGFAFVLVPNDTPEEVISALKCDLAVRDFRSSIVIIGGPGVKIIKCI